MPNTHTHARARPWVVCVIHGLHTCERMHAPRPGMHKVDRGNRAGPGKPLVQSTGYQVRWRLASLTGSCIYYVVMYDLSKTKKHIYRRSSVDTESLTDSSPHRTKSVQSRSNQVVLRLEGPCLVQASDPSCSKPARRLGRASTLDTNFCPAPRLPSPR